MLRLEPSNTIDPTYVFLKSHHTLSAGILISNSTDSIVYLSASTLKTVRWTSLEWAKTGTEQDFFTFCEGGEI